MELEELQLDSRLSKYESLLCKLSSRSQIPKLVHLIENDQKNTAQELNAFIKNSNSRINYSVRSLELEKTNFTTTLAQFHESLDALSDVSVQASSISDRLSKIKAEAKHVHELADFVYSVKFLKNNLKIIADSLEWKEPNYNLITQSIYEIDQLPSSLLNSNFVQRCVPTSALPEQPTQLLNKWKSELKSEFCKMFMKAAEDREVKILTQCFEFFPKIDAADTGIHLYSKYICDIVAKQSRSLMMASSDDPLFYSKSLLHLFKTVSQIINEHSKIILQSYSSEYMLEIMEKLQLEADLQSCLIWDTFVDAVALIKVESSLEEDNDMKSLQLIISQFSSFLQNWSMYCQFFSMKWSELGKNREPSLVMAPCLTSAKFHSKLEVNLVILRKLALRYVNQCFKSSLQSSSIPNLNEALRSAGNSLEDDQPVISPVLEDLAILVKSFLVWNLNTGQARYVQECLTSISQFIQNEYLINYLQLNLRRLMPRLTSSLKLQQVSAGFTDDSETQKNLTAQFSAFNIKNVDTESIQKLHHYVIFVNTISSNNTIFEDLFHNEIITNNPQFLTENFKFGNDQENVSSKLSSILNYLLNNNKKLWEWSILKLYQNVLQENLNKLISQLFQKNDEFVCTLQDFEDFHRLQAFIDEWNHLTQPYKSVMSQASFHSLLRIIIDDLCPLLESKFLSLKFNELGSIKIEKQLSIIIKTICIDNYGLRERFKKLTQMCLLLGFEEDQFDVSKHDLKEDVLNSLNWLLTSAERVAVRKQRVDKRL